MDADTLPPLRVGIIGTGGVAHLHAAALTGRDDTRIVAAIDTDAERARRFAAQYGIPASGTSFAELPEVDVLHLCTPPGVHAEQAEAAFALGAHVVVEKPPALSLAEVDRMRVLTVADVMAAPTDGVLADPAVGLAPGETLHEAADRLHRAPGGALPVIADGRVVGQLTAADVLGVVGSEAEAA